MRKNNLSGKQKIIKKCNANYALQHNIGYALFFDNNGDTSINSFNKRDKQLRRACKYI